MQRQQTKYDLAEMSEALGVSRRGYYRWAEAKPSARREQDELIKPVIEQVVRLAHGPYGYRPVHQHLREQGVDCGRDRTLRLMRELDLVGRAHTRFKPIGTDSEHLFGYHPNLLKQVGKPEHRDQIWVADTTYLLSDAGWCYLATVMDLCTRRIVGWSVSQRNDTALVCTALENAALTRGDVREGIVHHSDRGSTYASDRYQRLLAKLKMHPSMSAKGNCYPAHAGRRWNRSSVATKPPRCATTSSPTKPRCEPTSSTPSKSSTTDTVNMPRWATSARCKQRQNFCPPQGATNNPIA